MDDMNVIDTLEWHDGILVEVNVMAKIKLNITLTLQLYKNNEARNRGEKVIHFLNIDDLNISIDGDELERNRKSGNISNGYVKSDKKSNKHKFYLYLIDGQITFTFTDVIIK